MRGRNGRDAHGRPALYAAALAQQPAPQPQHFLSTGPGQSVPPRQLTLHSAYDWRSTGADGNTTVKHIQSASRQHTHLLKLS